jgi:hypothetical protein
MTPNPFISDILSQPAALRDALEHCPAEQVEPVCARLRRDESSRAH